MSEARIRALLGGARYARLFAAVRDRVEAGGGTARSVTLRGLAAEERTALAELLGWRTVPEESARVELLALDGALRSSAVAASLEDVLVTLGGPLADRRSAHAERRAEVERLWTAARARLTAAGRAAELGPWLEALRSTGALLRAAGAAGREPGPVLDEALRVALALPAEGRLLAVLAAEVTGDPHALDAGTPLASLVLRAAAVLAGWPAPPANAAARRRLWQEVGVDCDALSAQVLVLGLRPTGNAILARHLREAAEDGEPRRVTLRELRRAPMSVAPGTEVFVCENPAVVEAAADALAARCAALVCVEGVPSTAALRLLGALARAGARVRVHADFDWAGLRIAGQVLAATRGAPWRFGAHDYASALEAGGHRRPRLVGPASSSPWEPGLAGAIAAAGVALPEESVLEHLLDDLR